MIAPLFDSRNFGANGSNWGGYRNPDVDALIARATVMPDAARAQQAWADAAQRLMDDDALVPLMECKMFYVRSRRVRGCQ